MSHDDPTPEELAQVAESIIRATSEINHYADVYAAFLSRMDSASAIDQSAKHILQDHNHDVSVRCWAAELAVAVSLYHQCRTNLTPHLPQGGDPASITDPLATALFVTPDGKLSPAGIARADTNLAILRDAAAGYDRIYATYSTMTTDHDLAMSALGTDVLKANLQPGWSALLIAYLIRRLAELQGRETPS